MDERENMFGKIIYYDKKTIADYKSIINGKPNLEIEEYDVSNDRGINADLKIKHRTYGGPLRIQATLNRPAATPANYG